MFYLSKIFNISKKFALPDTLLKSKNNCSTTGTTGVRSSETSPLLKTEVSELLASFAYNLEMMTKCGFFSKQTLNFFVLLWQL